MPTGHLQKIGDISKTLCLLGILGLIPESSFAGLSTSKLKQYQEAADGADAEAKASFEAKAKAFTEAIAFSTFHPQSRVKLPGSFEPYFEVGFHAFRVDNEQLKLLIDGTATSTPDFFHGIFLKGGTGLPFGFNVEAGFSQVATEHKSTSIFATVSGQILDFANLVYIDLVPSLTMSGSVLRTIAGPAVYNFSGQTTIGAYHRTSLSQFGFIVQYSYAMLVALSPSIGNHFVRFGAMSNLPIYEGVFLRTEVFYPSMSATLSTGYQF